MFHGYSAHEVSIASGAVVFALLDVLIDNGAITKADAGLAIEHAIHEIKGNVGNQSVSAIGAVRLLTEGPFKSFTKKSAS